MARYRIPMDSLKAVINPLSGSTWKIEPIDPTEILAAAERGELEATPWPQAKKAQLPPESHRDFHIRRVAYLLGATATQEDTHKLMLAVSPDEVWFYDGNHGAAAAIVRNDPFIDLHIAASDYEYLADRFPGIKLLDPPNVPSGGDE